MQPLKHLAACLIAVVSATLVAMSVDDRTLLLPLLAVLSCPLITIAVLVLRERRHVAVPAPLRARPRVH